MTALYVFVGQFTLFLVGMFLSAVAVCFVVGEARDRRKRRALQMTPPLCGNLHFRDGSIRLTRATCPDDAIRTLIRESSFSGIGRAPTDRGSR